MNTFEIESMRQLDSVYKPSKSEFNEKYAFKNKPVLVKGLMEHWKARQLWTSRFFEAELGEIEVHGVRSNNKQDKKLFKISEYIQYMKETSDLYPYYLKNCEFHLNTDLVNHYLVPDYFCSFYDSLPRESRPSLSWIFIGAKKTYSGLHLDILNTSAWNGVISGQKIWLFYPPEQAKYLYNGAVNPFYPDSTKYPNYSKCKPFVCVQNPGEVVYTPSGWWHAVFNEEGGISLTENFVNEVNYEIVRETMNHYRMTQEVKRLDEVMNQFMSSQKHTRSSAASEQ